jgi:hypothetical protein
MKLRKQIHQNLNGKRRNLIGNVLFGENCETNQQGSFFLIRRNSSLFAFMVKLIFQQNGHQPFSVGVKKFETYKMAKSQIPVCLFLNTNLTS